MFWRQVKKQQQKITQVLDAKLVAYVVIDVASSEDDKLRMRELMNDETALPPQIFKGDTHLGVRRALFRLNECVSLDHVEICALQGFDVFEEAVETETVKDFLRL